MSKLKQYLINLAISLDMSVNTIFGGDPSETISSRMGKWAKDGANNHGWRKPIYWIANKIVNVFQKDHFAKSIETDRGANSVIE